MGEIKKPRLTAVISAVESTAANLIVLSIDAAKKARDEMHEQLVKKHGLEKIK